MFENLSEKLDKAFKVLKGQGNISSKYIKWRDRFKYGFSYTQC